MQGKARANLKHLHIFLFLFVFITFHIRAPGQRNRLRDGAVLANKKRVIVWTQTIKVHLKKVTQVIKMLVIVVLLFSLSWLPYQVPFGSSLSCHSLSVAYRTNFFIFTQPDTTVSQELISIPITIPELEKARKKVSTSALLTPKICTQNA